MTAAVKDNQWDWNRADSLYGKTFRDWGLDIDHLSPQEAGERIRRSTVAIELAAALDDWSMIRRKVRGAGDASWKNLLQVARAADGDEWRTRVREALGRGDQQTL